MELFLFILFGFLSCNISRFIKYSFFSLRSCIISIYFSLISSFFFKVKSISEILMAEERTLIFNFIFSLVIPSILIFLLLKLISNSLEISSRFVNDLK